MELDYLDLKLHMHGAGEGFIEFLSRTLLHLLVDSALQSGDPSQSVSAVHADVAASVVQSDVPLSDGAKGSARALATLAEASKPLREEILESVAKRAGGLPQLAHAGGWEAITQLLETLADRVLPACGPTCSDAEAGPVADLTTCLIALAQLNSTVLNLHRVKSRF